MSSAFGPAADEQPDEQEWLMCGVCGFPLHHSARGFFHAREDDAADHIAVPVPMNPAGMNMRCDVCDSSPVTHLQDAERFHMGLNNYSSAGWALCAPCARAASAADLSDPLMLRYLQTFRERHPGEQIGGDVYAAMSQMYERLQAHRKGWPVPLGQAPRSALVPTVPRD